MKKGSGFGGEGGKVKGKHRSVSGVEGFGIFVFVVVRVDEFCARVYCFFISKDVNDQILGPLSYLRPDTGEGAVFLFKF